jgi:hypothetical protein
VRNSIPLYEDTKLPFLNEWLGPIIYSRSSSITDILEATSDLLNLHQYISTNPALYSVLPTDKTGQMEKIVSNTATVLGFGAPNAMRPSISPDEP